MASLPNQSSIRTCRTAPVGHLSDLGSAGTGPVPEPDPAVVDMEARFREAQPFSLIANSPAAYPEYRHILNLVGHLFLAAYRSNIRGVGSSELVKTVGEILTETFDYQGQAISLGICRGTAALTISVGTGGVLLRLLVTDSNEDAPYFEEFTTDWMWGGSNGDETEFRSLPAFIEKILQAPTSVEGEMSESWERNPPKFLSAK